MPTFLDYAAFRQRFLDSGEWLPGELHCRDSLALADDPATWQQLGVVLAHRACKAGAETAFSNAARLDPGSARTHYWLGKLADERGEFDAAATRYETALACDPGFEPARFAARFNAVARREIAYAREQTGDVVLQGAAPRFLLIKAWGAGFWSEILHLLGALLTAEVTGRIPVVLWGGNSMFREPGTVDGYTHFFEPVSAAGLADLPVAAGAVFPPKWTPANIAADDIGRQSGDFARLSGARFVGRPEPLAVIDYFTSTHLARHWIPAGHPLHGKSTAEVDRWLAAKYLRPRAFLAERAAAFRLAHFGAGSPFAAVQLRGTDKSTEMPLMDALNRHALEAIGADGDVFVLTDSVRWQRAAAERLGTRGHFTAATRGTGTTGVHFERNVGPRQLGEEVLTDVLVGAGAARFLGNGWSSVSCGVRVLSDAAPDAVHLLGPFDMARDHYGEYY